MDTANRILRYIAALFAGTFAFVLGVSMLHMLAGWLIPEANLSVNTPGSPEEWRVFIEALPFHAKLSVLFAHWGGTMGGAAVAVLLSGRRHPWPGWFIGVLGLIGGAMNNVEIPSPMWMQVVDLIGYVPLAVWVSWRLTRGRSAA